MRHADLNVRPSLCRIVVGNASFNYFMECSFGNLVMIKDNKGFTSVLIGMRSLLISTGNEVLAGEPIAKISSTLQSQLYFELRENGKIVDPKSKVEIL